jgi:hypothetical protein
LAPPPAPLGPILERVPIELAQVAAALPAYEIGGELGRGSTGVVLAAEHRQLGRQVAIKLLPADLAHDPAVRRRFVAEARLLASFSHVHVVSVYDFVEEDGLCLLVLERLGGGTLFSRARAGLDAPAGCAAVVALCAALHYAHERGVLHRDVKPANVLLAEDGLVKVTDFGIAKVLGGSETLATQSGVILGTPAYMAPEQADGGDSGNVGPATDIYGAGTVLYELLAGRLPFDRDASPLQMLYSHVHSDPLPLLDAAPEVPPELADVVMRSLAHAPNNRQATAQQLGLEVASAAASAWGAGWLASTPFTVAVPAGGGDTTGGTGSITTSAGLPETIAELPQAPSGADDKPPAASSPRRRVALAVGATVAVLAIGGGAIALLSGGGDDPKKPTGSVAKPTPPPVKGGAWSALHPAPVAQQQMPGAVVNGLAIMTGGLRSGPNGAVSTNSVEGLDTTVNIWSTLPGLKKPLNHAMAVNFKGRLFVMGGWLPKGGDQTAITSNRVYELHGSKWVEGPPMPDARAAGAAAVADGKIVVVGGQANDKLLTKTDVYDGKRWSTGAPIKTPREHLAAASDGESVYAVGGRNTATGKNLGTLERYDAPTDTWQALPDMQTPRNGLGAAIVGGTLFAIGGETATEVLKTVETYDIGKRHWSKGPPLPTARHGMAVVAVGDNVYALGGALKVQHNGSTNTAEKLTITK